MILVIYKFKSVMKVGDQFTHEFSFSQEDVIKFAQLTQDHNPLHLDEAYAATTAFKKPIMHGMLSASVYSKVFGTMFPGEGTVYLKQILNFMRPMYVNTIYMARFNVKEINGVKNTALIETSIVDKTTNKICISGEAAVMNKEKIKE